MTDSNVDDETTEPLDQPDMARSKCDVCRGKGKVEIVGEDGGLFEETCPCCRGRGRILGDSSIGFSRIAGRSRLALGRHRSAGGGRPSRRGPLLPLLALPGHDEPMPGTRLAKSAMPSMQPSLRPISAIDNPSDDRQRRPTEPAYRGVDIDDMVIGIAKAANLDADSISRLRLCDVLWANSAIFIREGAGAGRQIHVPQELRNHLYDYLQGRLIAGIPDDPESPLFEETPQSIHECLAKAAAKDHWDAVSARVDQLLAGRPLASDIFGGADSARLGAQVPTDPGLGPMGAALAQARSLQAMQAGDDALSDAVATGHRMTPTAVVDAMMGGFHETALGSLADEENHDVLGARGTLDINPLHGIGPGI